MKMIFNMNPTLKEVIDNGFIYYPAPLQIMAQFKILRLLWMQYDMHILLYPDTGCTIINIETENRKKVIKNIKKLKLPTIILDQLVELAGVVEDEIYTMKCMLQERAVKVESSFEFSWTGWGTIHQSKTLKKIINNNQSAFPLLACFGLEDEMERIWESMDYVNKSIHLHFYPKYSISMWAVLLVKRSTKDSLVFKKYMDVDIDDLYEKALTSFINECSEENTKYFFKLVDSEKRNNIVSKWAENLNRYYWRKEEINTFLYLFFNTDCLKSEFSRAESLISQWPWKFFVK